MDDLRWDLSFFSPFVYSDFRFLVLEKFSISGSASVPVPLLFLHLVLILSYWDFGIGWQILGVTNCWSLVMALGGDCGAFYFLSYFEDKNLLGIWSDKKARKA